MHRFDIAGYLFFRDVVDAAVLDALRGSYLSALQQAGVVDRQSTEPLWNGVPTDGATKRMGCLERAEPWKLLRDDRKLARTLGAVMQETYAWLPLTTYRVVAPAGDRSSASAASVSPLRFTRVHQDGYNNPHLNFIIFWMPLIHIGADVGGVALAEGYHHSVLSHDTSGATAFGVSEGEIADRAWAHGTFEPGDLLALHALTPHSGLTNRSPYFRMSLDFRLSPERHRPFLGTLLSISSDALSIRTDRGTSVRLRVDEDTAFPYRRGSALRNGGWIPRADVSDYLRVGQRILATAEQDRARLVRGFDIGVRG